MLSRRFPYPRPGSETAPPRSVASRGKGGGPSRLPAPLRGEEDAGPIAPGPPGIAGQPTKPPDHIPHRPTRITSLVRGSARGTALRRVRRVSAPRFPQFASVSTGLSSAPPAVIVSPGAGWPSAAHASIERWETDSRARRRGNVNVVRDRRDRRSCVPRVVRLVRDRSRHSAARRRG